MRFVVIDTNCLIRMIPLHGKYRPLWESFLDGKYILCISNEIVSEYMGILSVKVSPTFASNILLTLDQFIGDIIQADGQLS